MMMGASAIFFYKDCQPEGLFQNIQDQWEWGSSRLMPTFRPSPQKSWPREFHMFFFIKYTDPAIVQEDLMNPCHMLGVLYVARHYVENAGKKGLDFNRVEWSRLCDMKASFIFPVNSLGKQRVSFWRMWKGAGFCMGWMVVLQGLRRGALRESANAGQVHTYCIPGQVVWCHP